MDPRMDVRLLMGANGIAILWFGIFPESLMALCLQSIQASM